MIKPRELHNWYLEITKKIDSKFYNKNAQKNYNELSDEQKLIDEYIANKINEKVRNKKRVIFVDKRTSQIKFLFWFMFFGVMIEEVNALFINSPILSGYSVVILILSFIYFICKV